MRKLLLTIPFLFAILTVVSPTSVSAQTKPSETPAYKASYVPCGTDDVVGSYERVPKVDENGDPVFGPDGKQVVERGKAIGDGIVDNPCGFSDVVDMAKRIITGWILAGVTFATMGFAYAGYLYITAMGSSEKITHAHSIFTKTALGFVFMLSAWLIVYAMQEIFLTDEAKKNSFLQR